MKLLIIYWFKKWFLFGEVTWTKTSRHALLSSWFKWYTLYFMLFLCSTWNYLSKYSNMLLIFLTFLRLLVFSNYFYKFKEIRVYYFTLKTKGITIIKLTCLSSYSKHFFILGYNRYLIICIGLKCFTKQYKRYSWSLL